MQVSDLPVISNQLTQELNIDPQKIAERPRWSYKAALEQLVTEEEPSSTSSKG